MVKLEVGKYYKTRDGRKVGPMIKEGWDDGEPWTAPGYGYYGESGKWDTISDELDDDDIVSEWVDYKSCKSAQVDEYGPIRTRREIVPGTYGVIRIDKGSNGPVLDLWKANPTAEELREAAHLFNQLAEVLEDV
jgi:hypothetical protein